MESGVLVTGFIHK